MRAILAFLVTLAAGTALGLFATRWAAANIKGAAPEHAGVWEAWPRSGTPEAEPYSRAFQARNAYIPLGAGEGIALFARLDDQGQPLRGACTYRIGGTTPNARFWTISAYTPDGAPMETPLQRAGFTSAELVRDEQGRFDIAVAADVQPGDWLQISPRGRFELVLRLYETVLSASAFSLDPKTLPDVTRVSCR